MQYTCGVARSLADKVIAITGASTGIGAATAVACAQAGMRVALGARRQDPLREVADQVEQAGGKALVVPCDVDRDEDVQRLVEQTTSQFGRLDAIFANAGYGLCAKVADTSDEQMRAIFETNYYGMMRVIHAAVPLMRAQGDGHILICSSAVSELGLPMHGAYCATKAAQDAIASAMRAELAHEGINVSSVHPVGTRTDLYETARTRSGQPHNEPNTPSKLIQSSEQVARQIVKCLRRPKAEVWPHWPSRIGLAIVTAFPVLGANAMRSLMRKRYGYHIRANATP